MEQMYMIEIFIDKVSVYSDPQENSTARKKLIVTVRFGPNTEFVIKEGSFSDGKSDDKNIEYDEKTGRETITRAIRVGKAYLFPSYPDTVLQILDRFPLEISVWNDDENEKREFVGIGTMLWDTEFYNMLRVTSDACKPSKPLSIKQITPLMDECCCGQVGNIAFILRLSALGGSIMTTFQQLPKEPESFIFTTDRNDSVFQCKRVEGGDPNFALIGKIHKSSTLEDPGASSSGQRKIQICTQMDSCATDAAENTMYICVEKPTVKPVISTIRMGDIKGPCGNTNCTLAQKIKIYLRKTDAYKKQAAEVGVTLNKKPRNKKVCGECTCNKDKWHREDIVDKKNVSSNAGETICQGCGGVAQSGSTCENMDDCDDLAPSAPKYDGRRDIPDNSSCNCQPPKEKPLCGAIDCDCREEMVNKETRKDHQSYCPSYKHRQTCPVTTMNVEIEPNAAEDDDEKEEPLPYGLPPIKLGPCPVIGKPCSVPDGFARMYKVQTQPPQPPSYGEAGKICCSKEFERIKTFLNDCMKEDVQDDFRCFNALEASASMSRCCDNDQLGGKLAGKDCCGYHKAKGIPKRD